MDARLLDRLQAFPVASPDLVAARELHRRFDTKLMLSVKQAERVLETLAGDYAVLLAGGSAAAHYRTLYFDDPALGCFHAHRRGRLPRYKIRIRRYVDRAAHYLEVKQKGSGGHTIKRRQAIAHPSHLLSPEQQRFIEQNSPLAASALRPILWTDFRRVTLLGLRSRERITFDLDLRFEAASVVGNCAVGSYGPMGVVIAEVKQEHLQPRSPVSLALRAQRAVPVTLSKYCTGAGLLYAPISSRHHLPVLRAMKRLERV